MDSLLNRIKRRVNEDQLLKKVRPYTLLSTQRLRNLRRLAAVMNLNHVEGDFVECGTYKGGSACVLGSALNSKRHLWLYDSFQGMPAASEIDGQEAKASAGVCRASERDVVAALSTLGLSGSQYTIRKGWFKETFKEPLPAKVAFLHCDADWYDSVLLTLETFYPLIPPGGCIVLDDFGYWEGCREGFYDFCFRHREKPLLERVGIEQAYWIKGKAHNRA